MTSKSSMKKDTESCIERVESTDQQIMIHEVQVVENVESYALLAATAEDDDPAPASPSSNVNADQPEQSDLPETVMSPNDIGASACPERINIPETAESPHKIEITFFEASTPPEILEKVQHMSEFKKNLSEVVRFGRDPTNNDIVLPPDTMSRKYIEIQLKKDRKKLLYIIKNVSKNKRVMVGEEVLFTNDMVQVEGKTTINLSNDLTFRTESVPGDIGSDLFSVSVKVSDETKEIKHEPLSKIEILPESSGRVVNSQMSMERNTFNHSISGVHPISEPSLVPGLDMNSLQASLPSLNQQVSNHPGQYPARFPPYGGFNQYSMVGQGLVSHPPLMSQPLHSGSMAGQTNLHRNTNAVYPNPMVRQPPAYYDPMSGQPLVYQDPMAGPQHIHWNSAVGSHPVNQNPVAEVQHIHQSVLVGQPHVYQNHQVGRHDHPQTPDSACITTPDYRANMFTYANGPHNNLPVGLPRIPTPPQNGMQLPFDGRNNQLHPNSIPVLTVSTEIFRQAPSIISSLGSVAKIPVENAENKCPD